MHLLIKLLTYVTMVITVPVIKYETAKRCSDIHCENDSHCQETLVLQNEAPPIPDARCICNGFYTGPRCEAKLVLTSDVVKATYIEFRILFQNVSTGNYISSDSLVRSLSYTLQYWKNVSERSCSISTDIRSNIHRLEGLEMDTSFTICAITDSVSSCTPRKVNVSTEPNCIVVRTGLNDGEPFWSKEFMLPVAISVIVILILTILAILCLLKRKFLSSNNQNNNGHKILTKHKQDWAKVRRKEKVKEQTLAKESSLDDLLADKYATPDNSIDRRITRQAGTSTFAPLLNRNSLPNVLEETNTDEFLDIPESSQRPYSVSEA